MRAVIGLLLTLGGMNTANPQPNNPIQQVLYSLAKGLSSVFDPAPPPGSPTVEAADPLSGTVAGSLGFPTGGGLTFTATDPAQGSVEVTADGTFTYTPTTEARQSAGAATTDTFTATAHNGLSTSSVSVTVPVDPGTPIAGSPTINTPSPDTGTVTGAAIFTDTAGRTLTYSTPAESSGGGAVSLDSATGMFTYTPTEAQRQDAGDTSTDSFVVTASNGVRSATETVSVVVAPAVLVDQSPVAGDPGFAITATNAFTGIVAGTVDVSDPDGDALTYALAAALDPDLGVVAVDAQSGAWAFRPSPQARLDAWLAETPLTAGFSITASDGQAEVTVAVSAPVEAAADFAASVLDGDTSGGGTVVALGGDGTVYVDAADGLSAINPDGSAGDPVVLGFRPWDAVVGPDGRIYATDYWGEAGVVVADSSGGQPVALFAPITGAAGLAFGPDGRLYVASLDQQSLSILTSDGQIADIVDLGAGAYPADVAIGADGSIYVADFSDDYGSTRVSLRNPDGTIADTLYTADSAPLGDFTVTLGVAVDGHGAVYVADGNHDILTVLSPDGTSTVTRAPASGIALGPDGSVYLIGDDGGTTTVLTPIPVTEAGFYSTTDPDTGVVSGGLNLLDPGGQLTYTLDAPVDAAVGTVIVDPASGQWRFTPTGQAGFAAWTSGQDGAAEFTITASDGTATMVSAPVIGQVDLDTEAREVGGTPTGIALDADGRLYIADPDTQTVTVYTPDGTLQASIELAVSAQALAINPDGLIVATTYTDNTLTTINPADGFAVTSVALGSHPAPLGGIAIDTAGQVYLTSPEDNTVTLYHPSGAITAVIDVSNPTAVAVGPDGRIAVVGYDTNGVGYLNLYQPDTTLESSWVMGGAPFGVAVTPDGHLVVTDLGGPVRDIALLTADGTRSATFTLGAASMGITAGPDGRLYLTNPNDGTITVVTPVPVGTAAVFEAAAVIDSIDEATGAVTGHLTVAGATGGPLTYAIDTPPLDAFGQAVIDPGTGVFTYTPTVTARQSAGAETTDTFTATVTDGNGGSTSLTVTVAVDPGTPVAGTATVNTPDPDTGVVTGTAVFTDTAGRTLTYSTPATSSGGGTVSLDAATGVFTYTPTDAQRQDATDTTTDTFVVTATNGVRSAVKTISVVVVPSVSSSQDLVVGDPGYSVASRDAATGVVTGGVDVTSPSGGAVTYMLDGNPNPWQGGVSVDPGTGVWTFTPTTDALLQAWSDGADGSATFTITATAGQQSVQIAVSAPIGVDTEALTAILQRDGSTPSAVAVGADGQVYVTNSGASTVSIIAPGGDSLMTTVAVGSTPTAVAVDAQGRVWVVNTGDNTVSVLDADATPLGDAIPVGTAPAGIAFGIDGSAYIANSADDTVSVIGPTLAAGPTITVGNIPVGVAAGPDGRIYVANYGGGSISIIDPADNFSVDELVFDGANPFGIAVESDGSIAVTDPENDLVIIFTPNSQAIQNGAVAGLFAAAALAADFSSTNGITTSSGASSYTEDTIAVGSAPTAITAAGQTLHVTNSGSNTVTTISPQHTTSNLQVGWNPQGVAVGPDGTVWSANSGSDSVTKTDPQTLSTTDISVAVDTNDVNLEGGALTVTRKSDGAKTTISAEPSPTITTPTIVQTLDIDAAAHGIVLQSQDGRYLYDLTPTGIVIIDTKPGVPYRDGVVTVAEPIPADVYTTPVMVGHYIYFGNQSATISVFDTQTNKPLPGVIDVGAQPGSLVSILASPEPDVAYAVVALGINSYGIVPIRDNSAVDADRFREGLQAYELPVGYLNFGSAAFSPGGEYLYVPGYSSAGGNGAAVHAIQLPIGQAAKTLAHTEIPLSMTDPAVTQLIAANGLIYAIGSQWGATPPVSVVTAIDPSSNTVVGEGAIWTLSNGYPTGAKPVVNPRTGEIYFAVEGLPEGGAINVVAPAGGIRELVKTPAYSPSGNYNEVASLAVSPDGEKLYVEYRDNGVQTVDIKKATLDEGYLPVDADTVGYGGAGLPLMISPNGRYLYDPIHVDKPQILVIDTGRVATASNNQQQQFGTMRGLFQRLEDTTNGVGDGMHIDKIAAANGESGYVVYFGGTGFTSKQELFRNFGLYSGVDGKPYVDEEFLNRIKDTVPDTAPIMLVGFSQGGMDAQNIAAALRDQSYKVTDVITIASPIIPETNTDYTRLHLMAEFDFVPLLTYGDVLEQAEADGIVFRRWTWPVPVVHTFWVGFAPYYNLADQFDSPKTSSIVFDEVKNDLAYFTGGDALTPGTYVPEF
ncbi:MAG: VCBS domain-containing protein [Mycobacterium sp.]|nr:VCBS domain-containing protein [Mycobacterium sp.]